MTEQEWAHCGDAQHMLSVLCGKASDRQLRLFALHCCRPLRPLLSSHWQSFPEQLDHALHVSEQDADGLAEPKPSNSVYNQIYSALQEITMATPRAATRAAARAMQALFSWHHYACYAVWYLPQEERVRARSGPALARYIEAVGKLLPTVVEAVKCSVEKDHKAARAAERCRQVWLLREYFPSPFRPHPAIDPAWLWWHDSWILKCAHAAYSEGRFEALPVLADALEEAGCNDAQILDHLREPGPHGKGCWVVDLILSKDR